MEYLEGFAAGMKHIVDEIKRELSIPEYSARCINEILYKELLEVYNKEGQILDDMFKEFEVIDDMIKEVKS